ncbi:MAG: hypothetical protein MHPSP_002594, partial [Paramarteilia canceri]
MLPNQNLSAVNFGELDVAMCRASSLVGLVIGKSDIRKKKSQTDSDSNNGRAFFYLTIRDAQPSQNISKISKSDSFAINCTIEGQVSQEILTIFDDLHVGTLVQINGASIVAKSSFRKSYIDNVPDTGNIHCHLIACLDDPDITISVVDE